MSADRRRFMRGLRNGLLLAVVAWALIASAVLAQTAF